MKKIDHVLNMLEKILLTICGLLLAVMVISICYQVILRYCFKGANTWAEELARYSMEWIVMLAAPVAFRRHRHTRVDFLIEKIPENIQRYLQFILYCLMLLFVVRLGGMGLDLVKVGGEQLSPGMRIPMRYMYCTQIVGPILMFIFIVECVVKECMVPIYNSFRRVSE